MLQLITLHNATCLPLFIFLQFFLFCRNFLFIFSLAFSRAAYSFPAKKFPIFLPICETGSIARGIEEERMTMNLCCTFCFPRHNFSARFRAFNFRIALNVYAHLKFNLVFSSSQHWVDLKTLKCFMHVLAWRKKGRKIRKSRNVKSLRKSKFNYFPESTRTGEHVECIW